jgi:hypothetical protein
LGVVNYDENVNANNLISNNGFCFGGTLMINNEFQLTKYGEKVQPGDTVIMNLNSKKGTLSFGINKKKNYGVAFKGCKGKKKIALCYVTSIKGKFK